jgi:membrane-associated phospholipid phosphatase
MQNFTRHLVFTLAVAGATASATAQAQQTQPIEPTAGNWKTWIISSGRDFRVPPPPDAESTKNENAWLQEFTAQAANDKQAQEQIRFWDAGPVYRWMDYITNRTANAQPMGAFPRAIAYVPIAIHDTTVAVWESKYFYNRARPTGFAAPNNIPASPSYPSEYAAISAAAAEVMAYLVPAEAANFRAMAEEAGRSRLAAGLEYPSDYEAGLALGRRIAGEVIARARQDGSDSVFSGPIPTGPCNWTGTNPGNVTGPMWKPFVLSSPSEFRPAPPPSCDSPQVRAELAEVRNFPRATTDPLSSPTFTTNWKAFSWQSPTGTSVWTNVFLNKWVLEDKLNTPQAARANAALGVTMFDSFIASQDGKYAYWYARPAQLDPSIVPLFPAPNFPSYPSNHSTFSASRAVVLAHLFPDRADVILSTAKEAGDSRIWAGIHFPMDNVAGVDLGTKVAKKVIERLEQDGSSKRP